MYSAFKIGVLFSFKLEVNVIFKAIKETVEVGILIESAIKPKLITCGKTFSRVLAEPVEERIMLFKTERFFRKSLLPEPGGIRTLLWQHYG